jgi:hypothetical protein
MTTKITSGDQIVALTRTIDEHPTLIGGQVIGHAALTAGERLIGLARKPLTWAATLPARKPLIGTTAGNRLTGDMTLAGEALIGTTTCHSTLMFGRAVMTGKALIGMTVAGEALVGTIWIRDWRDPREV